MRPQRVIDFRKFHYPVSVEGAAPYFVLFWVWQQLRVSLCRLGVSLPKHWRTHQVHGRSTPICHPLSTSPSTSLSPSPIALTRLLFYAAKYDDRWNLLHWLTGVLAFVVSTDNHDGRLFKTALTAQLILLPSTFGAIQLTAFVCVCPRSTSANNSLTII